jgi:hypothetical protein
MKAVLIIIAALVLLGVAGKAATAGYHCHYARVGDTIACL